MHVCIQRASYVLKNTYICGPVQFKPTLLKGQLYLGEVGREGEGGCVKKAAELESVAFPTNHQTAGTFQKPKPGEKWGRKGDRIWSLSSLISLRLVLSSPFDHLFSSLLFPSPTLSLSHTIYSASSPALILWTLATAQSEFPVLPLGRHLRRAQPGQAKGAQPGVSEAPASTYQAAHQTLK